MVNKYAKDRKLLKDEDPNLGDDIREGLAATSEGQEPQFEGQAKTVGQHRGQICSVEPNEQLTHWFEANPTMLR